MRRWRERWGRIDHCQLFGVWGEAGFEQDCGEDSEEEKLRGTRGSDGDLWPGIRIATRQDGAGDTHFEIAL